MNSQALVEVVTGKISSDAQNVALAQIRADQRAQPRESVNTDVVSEYAQDMAAGASFPPLVVFFDGDQHWLADGFHRRYAADSIGLKEMLCEVRAGSLRDAILYSCGANAFHGNRRSNEDKRRAVLKLLQDEEWAQWSDREIARQCAVAHPTVAKLRDELKPATSDAAPVRTFTNKHGTTSRMDVSFASERHEPQASPAERRAAIRVAREDITPPSHPTRGKAAICARVKDAFVALSGLPPAAEVVGFLRGTDNAIIVNERLLTVHRWLEEFASLWGDENAD